MEQQSTRTRRPSETGGEPDERGIATPGPQTVLDALYDPDCRAIIGAVADGPRTAAELSAACDLPLSTTYRKVETLVEASLVEAHTRIEDDGNHASQYRRAFDDLTVRVTDDGAPDVELTRPDGWHAPPV